MTKELNMNTENMTAFELIEYALKNPQPPKPYTRSVEQDNRERFYRDEQTRRDRNKIAQAIIKALENTSHCSTAAKT